MKCLDLYYFIRKGGTDLKKRRAAGKRTFSLLLALAVTISSVPVSAGGICLGISLLLRRRVHQRPASEKGVCSLPVITGKINSHHGLSFLTATRQLEIDGWANGHLSGESVRNGPCAVPSAQ